jgi:phosphate transport system substrate-binding protein
MKKLVLATFGLAVLVCTAASAQKMSASGATFPGPIYIKWFNEFSAANKGVQINYEAKGSGGGIKDLTDGVVDFAASDRPMTDAEIAAVKSHPLHFPTVLGAVVITYNIPGFNGELKLTPDTAAGIFMGSIKKWNDSKLAADNPGAKLPNEDIQTIHRSDNSGTTFVFTDYLCKVSDTFKGKIGGGAAQKIQWPVETMAGNGNPGVAGAVKQTPFSVGYVELTYAAQNKMPYATLKNAAGAWIKPTQDSVTAAAAAASAAKTIPADFRCSITNQAGKTVYPISTFTYLLIPSHFADAAKQKTVVSFLKWMLTDAQKEAEGLDYAPLPKDIVAREQKQIETIK